MIQFPCAGAEHKKLCQILYPGMVEDAELEGTPQDPFPGWMQLLAARGRDPGCEGGALWQGSTDSLHAASQHF